MLSLHELHLNGSIEAPMHAQLLEHTALLQTVERNHKISLDLSSKMISQLLNDSYTSRTEQVALKAFEMHT
jgi:hypothetical protein